MSFIPPPIMDAVTNPLTSDLNAATFAIQAAGLVQATTTETDTLRLLPGSLADGIE